MTLQTIALGILNGFLFGVGFLLANFLAKALHLSNLLG